MQKKTPHSLTNEVFLFLISEIIVLQQKQVLLIQ